VAVDGNRFGWVANQTAGSVTKAAADGSSFTSYDCAPGAAGVAVDAANNVWVAGYSSSTMCLVSAAGSIVSGSGFVGGGLTQPEGVAVDGGGTAWVVNYRAPGLTELAGAGTAQPGQALSPANGWAPDTGIVEGYGVAVDASGNLWVSSYGNNTVTEFVGLAVPVKTPLLGPVRVP
jgi:sugar lactone lactonase YvrE